MLLFCLYWLSNYILLKLAYIADTLLDFVFSTTNIEDHCNFENLAGTEKKDINHILSIFGDADHEIVIFLTHIILMIQAQHPFFKITPMNALLSI